MLRRLKKITWTTAIVLCAFILLPLTLQAASPMALKAVSGKEKGSESKSAETVELPPNLDTASIEKLMATMSDDQVRRLLLQELQKQAQKKMTSLEKFTSEPSSANPLFKVFDLEAAALHDMRENLDPEALGKAVDLLADKQKVLTVGFYANACLAHYAGLI